MAGNDYIDEGAVREAVEKVVPFPASTPRKRILATPFKWVNPEDIEPREWVYGRHYIRKFLSGTVAPGGFGKSTHELTEAVAMATGRDLLGVIVRQPLKVWYWNGEDPMDEIERKVAAICLHYNIQPSEIEGRLFLDSGRDSEIIVATEDRDGFKLAVPVLDDLRETIGDNGIDVWMLDPFVSCHGVSENDNMKIGAVMKALADVANSTNSSCDVVHHTRKARESGDEVTVGDARGAAAFMDRCRSVRTLTRMSKDEAENFGIETVNREYATYFRVEQGKANLTPASAHTAWRQLVDCPLGNSRPDRHLREDHIGVVVRWSPTDALAGFTAADTLAIQHLIHAGNYRFDQRAKEWVGTLIMTRMDWSETVATNVASVKRLLATWVKTGLIEAVEEKDKNRVARKFVRVKKWIEP